MTYKNFKQSQQNDFSAFPMFWAFSNEQFAAGLLKLDCTKEDLFSFGSGGYYRKSDSDKLSALLKKLSEEKKAFFSIRENLISALKYEMANHEYSYTYDLYDTLCSVNIDPKNVTDFENECIKVASAEYLASCEE